jgi:hypothetical protein
LNRLIRLAADYPWPVLAVVSLITLLFATQLGGLRIVVSAESMVEKGTPAWERFVETEKTFGSEDMAVVVLRDPQIFDYDKLVAIRYVLRELEDLPNVNGSLSLFDAKNLKNIDDTIHIKPYLEELPETAEAAAEIRRDALRNPLAVGNLISADGQTLAINLYLDRQTDDSSFDRVMTDRIEAVITPLREQVETVYQIGVGAMRADLTSKLQGDQKVFLPLSVLVLLLTLALSLRRATAALMPLVTAAISVVWTLGFMALAGIPVNIMTSIVPALVIIIGSTEDIHLVAEYAAGIRDGLDRQGAIGRMAENMGVAVLLTFITTYVGFLSITLNHIELLFQFGLVASTGLLFNFVVTAALVPVMLRLFGHETSRTPRNTSSNHWFQGLAVGILRFAQRHRLLVLGVAGILAIVAVAGATQLRINNNLLDYLDQGSELRANVERIHEELSGVHSFAIVVDGRISNTFQQVRYLEELRKIQQAVDSMPEFDRSFSFANFIGLVNTVMSGEDWPEDGEPLWLPESDDMVREYLYFIRHDDVAAFVSEAYDQARILVRHNISSSDRLNRAIAELQAFVDTEVDPALEVSITGKSVLSNKAVEEMANSQLQSLLLVGGVILTLVSALFVSVRAGLIALLPNLFPVAILFAVMAFSGIPLNAGTSMVAAIALGICVDDTMHVMSRFHEELKHHASRQTALEAMVRAEAVPIFATSIALAAGFAVFATSSFEPVVHFGLLSAMVILVALLATFILTPLLLGSSELLTVWDLLSYRIQKEALQRAPLFHGMYVWQIKKILLASEVRRFAPGDRIITEGDSGTEMYVVLEGAVEAQLRRDDEVRALRQMGVGQLFGEVGPLSGTKRTADVVATSPTQLLVLSWGRIERLTRRFPLLAFRLFRNLTAIIGQRLRQTAEYRG